MADLGVAFRGQLLADADVSAIVVDRIYPDTPEQGAPMPFAVYHEISGNSIENVLGSSGFAQDRIQVDCVAAAKTTASDLREKIRVAVQNHFGDMQGIFVSGVSVEGTSGDYEPPIDKSDSGRYVRRIDFVISHAEPG
jgi:uncharacterized protein DUF3168